MEMIPPTDEGNEICSNQTNSHICKKNLELLMRKNTVTDYYNYKEKCRNVIFRVYN